MAELVVHQEKVTKEVADELIKICPFNAIKYENGEIEIDAACKMCKICVKKGPKGVIEYVKEETPRINKSIWKGITVYVDHIKGRIQFCNF